ncbi:MAG: glucokinase [Rhodobacteraceae bacterium]|nr:glucokinase [Paracoccaceae bacterium]
MTVLVADVGGTNTRLALALDGVVDPASIRRFANDAHAGFLPVVQSFLADAGVSRVDGAAIAVAGPTSARGGRLTNRDWSLDVPMIRGFTDGPVRYLNDLKAMAYAVPGLSAAAAVAIVPETGQPPDNGQGLVVGIGTGFNVSPLVRTDNGFVATDAEFGHTAMPSSVARRMVDSLGAAAAARFATVESCFSGRGHAAARALLTDGADFEQTYAAWIGDLTRELILTFMPLGGVHFAGGVARAVLTGPGRAAFVDRLTRPYALNGDLAAVPVRLITDDYAPLTGCARFLTQVQPASASGSQ